MSTTSSPTESKAEASEKPTRSAEEMAGETTEETTEETAGETTEETTESSEDLSKADRLAAYLRSEASDGETYFKAKFISDDVGLSPKEIGALIVQLQDSVSDLRIEKWSYTGATTWRVTSR